MNAFLIERLALKLRDKLRGKRLTTLFTTSQFDIYFVFEDETLKVSFFQGQAFFQTPELDKLQKKNRLPVYKSLQNAQLKEILHYSYDRRFDLIFDNNHILAFYLFGKFSHITHYAGAEWQEVFPAKSSKILEYSQAAFTMCGKTVEDLKFLSKQQQNALQAQYFDTETEEQKSVLLHAVKEKALNQTLYINKGEKKYTLDDEAGQEPISHFTDVMPALDNYSRLYISHQVYAQTKASHLGQLTKELGAIEKKLKSAEKRLEELNRADGYKEKADLLMANLWQLTKGQNEVILGSFDGEREVPIKLQNTLTPQANAERYYKKAKNESKQREFALKHLSTMKSSYAKKMAEIETFDNVDNLKEIRKTADHKTAQKEVRLPYKTMQIDGFEVRIGKGARENDDLLRYHTTGTDLWLHAKDVSGSHVIIRNPNNIKILLATIEKVASVAAFYSKAKSETLAAVMYTQRKYIRKPKGATPGLVKVDKEEVILVEPKQSVN